MWPHPARSGGAGRVTQRVPSEPTSIMTFPPLPSDETGASVETRHRDRTGVADAQPGDAVCRGAGSPRASPRYQHLTKPQGEHLACGNEIPRDVSAKISPSKSWKNQIAATIFFFFSQMIILNYYFFLNLMIIF